MSTESALRLAHSPDSDDLVMWWPLTGMVGPDGRPVAGELGTPRVDTEGLSFTLFGRDVEQLNRAVIDRTADFDLTAISAAAYAHVAGDWAITRTGGSFGEGYGPKVVAVQGAPITGPADLPGRKIAVPGTRTSAFTTLTMMLAEFSGSPIEAEEMLFSEVPAAVLAGRADAGLLIHEAQLTYEQLGLRMVVDLGAWWQERTGGPLPLGLNVVRRDLDTRLGPGTLERVSRVLRRSVDYALANPAESREYLLLHAGSRSEWHDTELVEKYLAMYVSRMSVDMEEKGVSALTGFYREAHKQGLLPACTPDVI